MSAYADAMTDLGKVHFPYIFSQTFPDTMTITAANESQGADGGIVAGSVTNAYTNVPCSYQPRKTSKGRRTVGESLLSMGDYTVELATHTSAGTKIALDPKVHRFVVNARDLQPVKSFRIESVGDDEGLSYICYCTKEN